MNGDHDGLPSDEMELERGSLMGKTDEPPGSPTRPRSQGARTLRRAGVFAALAVVVAALIYSVHAAIPASPPGQATPAAAASFLPLLDLGCVRDAAWDPTSTYIALVGSPSSSFCADTGYGANIVNIYRARTAALVRQLHPDAAVFAALGLSPPVSLTPAPGSLPQYPQLTYQTLRWSPDGTRLALTFTLFNGFSRPDNIPLLTYGLVLLDADGSHERVLVDNLTSSPTAPQRPQPAYVVWDTQTDALIPEGSVPPLSSSQEVSPNSLSAALSYSWGSNGMLVPGVPLSASTPPPSPPLDLVGNPIGGDTFGFWQPGGIQIIAEQAAGSQTPTYLYTFQTSFAAWSPSGRYFVSGLNMGGLLLPGGQPPSQSLLKMAQLDGAVMLPVRDAALQQALMHDFPLPVGFGNSQASSIFPIAWRPDGKMLAIPNQNNGFTLRSTATGRIVMVVSSIELPPSSLPRPGAFGTPNALSWSPDGTWLLLPSLALVHVGRLKV